MERFRYWVQEKPWHLWAMLIFTGLLVFFAWRNYRSQRGGASGAVTTAPVAAGVDQNTEILAELKAIGDYISSHQTPNPPGSSDPLLSTIGVDPKGTAPESDNFWIPGSDAGHPGAAAPTQGQSFRQWIAGLWQAGWIKPGKDFQTPDQAAQWFSTFRNNGAILGNIDRREGYSGNPLDTPLAAGQQFAL